MIIRLELIKLLKDRKNRFAAFQATGISTSFLWLVAKGQDLPAPAMKTLELWAKDYRKPKG